MWNKVWDKLFANNLMGDYPPEELIRFMARNFYNVPDRGDVKVLEIGSGGGANLWYLAREGFDVMGIDGSAVGVARSIKRLKADSLKADVRVGDIIDLPFKNNMFDCVIDNMCLFANSYSDSRKMLDEIHRVLKPGGKFFSNTLMTGTSGQQRGRKLKGEKNTYVQLSKDGKWHGYGIIRFTSEKDIRNLYGRFNIESVDYIVRTERNRKYKIKEWAIICSKQKDKRRTG